MNIMERRAARFAEDQDRYGDLSVAWVESTSEDRQEQNCLVSLRMSRAISLLMTSTLLTEPGIGSAPSLLLGRVLLDQQTAGSY